MLEILSNTKLGEHFELFGKELNLIEPRSLEDIYKSHLENTRSGVGAVAVDSAKQNLAGSFVNGFVNAGFGNDRLMAKAEEGQSWIYKNKDHGESVLASRCCRLVVSPPDTNAQACCLRLHRSGSPTSGARRKASTPSTRTPMCQKNTSKLAQR